MKNLFSLFLGVHCLGCLCPETGRAAEPQKRALIVAISNYPADGGWQAISSANDVSLIGDVLALHGFPEKNVRVLTDGEARKAGILKALQELVAASQPGDNVFIHFSTHGQQVPDADGDEFDGLDEALVPYDARKRYEAGKYQGENHLRDDELGLVLEQLRGRLGSSGSVLVTLDACHSGSGTRGNIAVRVRGTSQALVPPNHQPGKLALEEKWVGSPAGARGETWPGPGAPLAIISAASPRQLNYETLDDNGNPVGSLTYALAKVLTNARQTLSYGAAFDEIKLVMRGISPDQDPEFEGTAASEVFSGRMVLQKPYYLPSLDRNNRIVIRAGTLLSVYPGTTVAFYPIGTPDPSGPEATPYATGRVTASSFLYSTIALDSARADVAALEKSWVFIREQHFGNAALRVKIDVQQHAALFSALQKALAAIPLVRLTDDPDADLLIDNYEGKGQPARGAHLVVSRRGKEIHQQPLRRDSIAQQVERLLTTIRYSIKTHYLVNHLTMQDPSLKIVCQIVPVTVDAGNQFQERPAPAAGTGGEVLHLQEGDKVVLKVTNAGSQRAYFTILDIQPDDRITVVVPYRNAEAKDFVLGPGETRLIRGFPRFPLEVTPPYGKEVYKVIATEQPIDLRQLLAEKDTRSRGFLLPFERLLRNASSARGTSDQEETSAPDAAHVETFFFEIIPKK